MNAEFHTPVLLEEAVHFLINDRAGVYVDGTLGGGGHAHAICNQLVGNGKLICFDADEDAIQHAQMRLNDCGNRTSFVHSNFRKIKSELARRDVREIRGVLFDLGVSSFQIDEEEKGFSFRGDEQIDMRMDRRQSFSGWNVVNEYEEAKLADVLWKYGEERNSRRIARSIVEARPVDSTGKLAAIVESVVGKKFLVKTLARVFQAIRIEVNGELASLQSALNDATDLMAVGGRLVVISYHSLEDRIVKEFFKEQSASSIPSGHKLIPDTLITPRLRVLTKNPLRASADEIARNPRARSAKMRVAERI